MASHFPAGHFPEGHFPEGHFLDAAETAFIGPDITDLTLLVNAAMIPVNFATRFTAASSLTFAMVGTLPDGLTLSTTGVLSGTPTTVGATESLQIQATDGEDTVNSNAFSITVQLSQVIIPAHRTLRVGRA